MDRIKSESPPPSPKGGVEQLGSYDLYTPHTPRANGSSPAAANKRKRPSSDSSNGTSKKKPCSATSRNRASQPNAQPKGKPKCKPKGPPPTIVFGVDLGTTHSGMAYGLSGNPNLGVIPFTRWGTSTTDQMKIPSVIKFGPENDTWGIAAKDLPDGLKWFKLLLVDPPDLDEEIRTSAQLQEARVALEASGKTAVEVTSIFLKRMFEHAVGKLKVARGAGVVDSSHFHVVFTVPAIWPENARRRMEQAVNRSGILDARPAGPTTHDFVSEPEAAAIATLSGSGRLRNIQEGETTVMVDCGGGTVDLITHKIIKPSPMTVQEVVRGKGALCGAIFVEERFRDLVVKKLREVSEDAMERVSEKDMQEIMTNDWEKRIRAQFNGQARNWSIRLPFRLIDIDRLDLSRGHPTFTITSEELVEVFRPSVEKIASLVNDQIDAAVKKCGKLPEVKAYHAHVDESRGRRTLKPYADSLVQSVILVGGFGGSGYLHEYLMPRCRGVEVLQCGGLEPLSAIFRGAVIHGMTKKKLGGPFEVSVKSRIARQSYGVVCQEPWDEEQHNPEDKWFDSILLKDVSVRVMKWHVVSGREVPVNHKHTFKFTKYLDEPPKSIVTIIYESQQGVPPARLDDTLIKAAEITWDMQVKWDSLEVFINDHQKTFRKLEYTVEMKCSAGATAFSIYHGGRRQASKNVALKFHNSEDV